MRLCECGCGKAVKWERGRFLRGHHWKTKVYDPPNGMRWSPEDNDLARLAWCLNTKGYAMAGKRDGKTTAFFHKMVLERVLGRRLRKGEFCDHINRVRLDNRRENLRVVDALGNAQNCGARSTNTSGYRGVTWSWRERKWKAQWAYKRKKYSLGTFHKIEEAVAAFERRYEIVQARLRA